MELPGPASSATIAAVAIAILINAILVNAGFVNERCLCCCHAGNQHYPKTRDVSRDKRKERELLRKL